MKNIFIFIIAFIQCTLSFVAQNTFSPKEFLGYNIGEQFTRHHRVVDYFYALEKAFPQQIKVTKIGQTYEKEIFCFVILAPPRTL